MVVKMGYKKRGVIGMGVGLMGLFMEYIWSLLGGDIEVLNLGEYGIKMNFMM